MENIQNFLSNYFKDKPVKKVYLFGSYAKNLATEKSDIDVLIELDYFKGIASIYTKMVIELNKLYENKIHLLTTNSVSDEILMQIEKERILIYER